jgi:hypothetical protein
LWIGLDETAAMSHTLWQNPTGVAIEYKQFSAFQRLVIGAIQDVETKMPRNVPAAAKSARS